MRRGFVIHWNGPAASCVGRDHSRCERFWQAVRDYHVNTKGWSDIAYSFGICPHGTRFTGRGWDQRQWANGTDQVGPDDGGDQYWYTVLSFIGEGEHPTAEMVQGVRDLIQEGRDWARCMDRVLPHNAFKVKTCPGPEFTTYAQAWDNQPLHEGAFMALSDQEQAELLSAVRAMHSGNWRTPEGFGDLAWLKSTVTEVVSAALASLPVSGDMTAEQIKDAVKAALREGTG